MAYNQNKDETGHDGALIISGEEIAITNADYDGPDPDWAENQFNDGLHANFSLSGVRYSGSFEFAGSSEDLRTSLYEQASDGTYEVPKPPEEIEIHIEEETEQGLRTVIFRGVAIGTRSRSRPSDDSTTTSIDFAAERMYHK